MRSPTRREFVLLALVAVVLIVVYSMDNGIGVGTARERKEGTRALGEAPVVLLALISREAEMYDPEGRDLFQYGPPPASARPKPPAPRLAPKPIERPKRVPPPPPRKPPPPRVVEARPPSIGFKYIGFLGPKDDKIAVLEEDEVMLLARIGEVVQNEFKVLGFGYESIVIGYTDQRFKDRTTEVSQESDGR